MALPEVRDSVSWPPLWTSLWELSFTTTIGGLGSYNRTGSAAEIVLGWSALSPASDYYGPKFQVYRSGLGDPWLWRVTGLRRYTSYPSTYVDVTAGAAAGTQTHRVEMRVYSEQDDEPNGYAYASRQWSVLWMIDSVVEVDISWLQGDPSPTYWSQWSNDWMDAFEPSHDVRHFVHGDFGDATDHIVEGSRSWVDVDCPAPVTLTVADVVSSQNGIIRYADDYRDGIVEGVISPQRDTSRKGVKVGGYEDGDGLHLTIPQAEVWGRYVEDGGVPASLWAPSFHDFDWLSWSPGGEPLQRDVLASVTFTGNRWHQPYSGIRHGVGARCRSGAYYIPHYDDGGKDSPTTSYRRYQPWDDPDSYQWFGVSYNGEHMLTANSANGDAVDYTNLGDLLVGMDDSTVSYDHGAETDYAEFYLPISWEAKQLDRLEALNGLFSWGSTYGFGPGRIAGAIQTGYIYTSGYVVGLDNGVATRRYHYRVAEQATLTGVSLSTRPDTEDYLRADSAAVAWDRVAQVPVLVGLQDVWTGSRTADTCSVEMVRQESGRVFGDVVTIAELPALSEDQAGYLLADVAMEETGRLWVAVWRIEHDLGDVSLLVYHQSDEQSEASLVSTTTGLERPPRWAGQLVVDEISGEVFFCYGERDGDELKLVALQVDLAMPVSKTIDMPFADMPDPGYGGWYGARASGARPWEDASWLDQRCLLGAGIWPTGRWRAVTDIRGFWDWQTTIGLTPLAAYAAIHEAPGYDRAGEYQQDDWTYSYADDAQVVHDIVDVAAAVDPLCADGEFAELSWRDW